MLEVFITVVVAVVVGGIILKFWRPILTCLVTAITIIISLVILVPVAIISLPANLIVACVSDERLEGTIVRYYDKMLHEASGPEELAKGRKGIKRIQGILRKREEKKHGKHVEEMLEEAKWVL